MGGDRSFVDFHYANCKCREIEPILENVLNIKNVTFDDLITTRFQVFSDLSIKYKHNWESIKHKVNLTFGALSVKLGVFLWERFILEILNGKKKKKKKKKKHHNEATSAFAFL